MNDSVEVFLSVGSNCGNRHSQVESGIGWLRDLLLNVKVSSIYSTGDCHGGPRDYYNAVVKGLTSMKIEDLDLMCKVFESNHGRTPDARSQGDVPIDIDVVVFDNEIIRPKDFRQKFFQIGYRQLF